MTGKTMAAASKELRDAGFELGEVSEEYSETVPEGRIISQSPATGTTQEEGTAIDLVLSLGQDPALHPSTQPTEPDTAATVPEETPSDEDGN